MPPERLYNSVQEMFDDIDPELGAAYRQHSRKPQVRLKKWWLRLRFRWQVRWIRFWHWARSCSK